MEELILDFRWFQNVCFMVFSDNGRTYINLLVVGFYVLPP